PAHSTLFPYTTLFRSRPPLIARCAGAADVAAVVTFAAQRGLPIAVRGGGHSVAGHALCEDGVVVDLSLMRAVRVEPDRRVAHVQDRKSTRLNSSHLGI